MGHERLTHSSPLSLSHKKRIFIELRDFSLSQKEKRKLKSSLLKKQVARIEKTPVLSHKKTKNDFKDFTLTESKKRFKAFRLLRSSKIQRL